MACYKTVRVRLYDTVCLGFVSDGRCLQRFADGVEGKLTAC